MQNIEKTILEAIEIYNKMLPPDKKVPVDKNLRLFSRAGFTPESHFDSMGLVNFLFIAEEQIKKNIQSDFFLDIEEIIKNKEQILMDIPAFIQYIVIKIQ